MSLTKEHVQDIAKLAALELSDDELEEMHTELNVILEYIDQLQSVNTSGVEATSHVHGVTNAFRSDVAASSLDMEAVTKNAPSYDARGFRVPKVI